MRKNIKALTFKGGLKMQKIPSLEELKELLNEARRYVKPKYIEQFSDWEDFIGALEYAYENFVEKSDKFWKDLAFYTWGVMVDNDFVSDCKEAFEILTQNGKDCKLETFRRIVDEAGLISSFEPNEIDPIYLAKVFINSAFSLEVDALIEKAKKIWLEKQKLS